MSDEAMTAVRLRVTLDGFEWIWRELLVPCRFDLRQLHFVIQTTFGWEHSEDYLFTIGGLKYGNPAYNSRPRFKNGARVSDGATFRLADFEDASGAISFFYEYEGPSLSYWEHSIT